MFAQALSVPAPLWRWKRLRRVGVALLLAGLADFLFWDEPAGFSLVVFLLALATASVIGNADQVKPWRLVEAAALLVPGLVPLVVSLDELPVLVAMAATGGFALLSTRERGIDPRRIFFLYTTGPWRFGLDMWRLVRLAQRLLRGISLFRGLIVWVVPALGGLVFLGLIVAANPVVESWFDRISLPDDSNLPPTARVMLWLVVPVMAWPFLRIRQVSARMKPARVPVKIGPPAWRVRLLAPASILRALVLFNLLFALETALDLTYLWAGVALPSGMTYAEYAHRGAYPLILTAILAGIFVLVALRPGAESQRSGVIRWLVTAWIAQNLMLVASSMLRLDLYIQVYSLTLWRVAAFLWMGLVGVALVLILARIFWDKSDRWLVRCNLAALALMLYGASLTDFARIVADFNVAHCREAGGPGAPLDVAYIGGLGAGAIPALDRFADLLAKQPVLDQERMLWTRVCRADLAEPYEEMKDDWRGWTFREDRLIRYLIKHPSQEMPDFDRCGDKSWR